MASIRPLERSDLPAVASLYELVARSGSRTPAPGLERYFEKTFFEGNASFGMRLPFLQLDGVQGGIDDNQIGDLTFILKWAFLNNLETGSLMSGGLVVTAPTGDDFIGINGEVIHSTLIQPFLGYIWNRESFFVHGFTSVVIPTDSEDVTPSGGGAAPPSPPSGQSGRDRLGTR